VTDWSPYEWQSPQKLLDDVEVKRSELGRLISKGPGRDFREAFVASRFAAFRNATAVKLLQPRHGLPTPDFAILPGPGEELWFETTEIDRPDRRRGDEPPMPPTVFQDVPDEHWVSSEIYAQTVRARVGTKALKKYDKCEGLIIWSNAAWVDDDDDLTDDWWKSVASAAAPKFSEVWVHTDGSFRRLF